MGEAQVNPFEERNTNVFNTATEVGLRCLYILDAVGNAGIDLDRLINYDYLLIHSGDVKGGPISIHPPLPFRSAQILVRREMIKAGINLIISKELARVEYTPIGFLYKHTELTRTFLQYLTSSYANVLKDRVAWVIAAFGFFSDNELSEYIKNNLDKWGGEFNKEALFRGEVR